MDALSKTIKSYIWIIALLFRRPSLLLLCLKPWAIGIGAWAGMFWLSYSLKADIDASLATLIPDQLFGVVEVLVIPILIILTGMMALLVALIANEYIIDTFIDRTIAEADPDSQSAIVRRTVSQQTIDGILRLGVTVPLTIACLIIGLIPLVGLISIVFSAFIFGYAIFDCPLCIMGYSFSQRFKYMWSVFWEVFWLGSIFSMTFFIPGLSLLFLPIGYGAAVKIITEPAQR